MNLTEEQMIEIIKNKKINECSENEKKQVMIFAFGEDFMELKGKSWVKDIMEESKCDMFQRTTYRHQLLHQEGHWRGLEIGRGSQHQLLACVEREAYARRLLVQK